MLLRSVKSLFDEEARFSGSRRVGAQARKMERTVEKDAQDVPLLAIEVPVVFGGVSHIVLHGCKANLSSFVGSLYGCLLHRVTDAAQFGGNNCQQTLEDVSFRLNNQNAFGRWVAGEDGRCKYFRGFQYLPRLEERLLRNKSNVNRTTKTQLINNIKTEYNQSIINQLANK